MLKFKNTLSGLVDDFEPISPPSVHMYCCGPTVYDYAHIGNFRTFMFEDILNRYLRYRGYDVLYVMNITDIDDKTIRNSRAAGVSLSEYTQKYTDAFFEDLDTLRIRRADVLCKATEHIDDMVRLVERLKKKGFTYEAGGSVYYKISQFKNYGKLSKKDFSGIKIGARVDADEYDKENARDFVLWKAHREGEPFWNTSIGKGRPGWHLECSTMSMKYLGESFDLHCGGVDLIFPHHENEIAQSEGATGKQFVRYWLHSEYLIVNGEKMSKSKGNFYTLRDLVSKKIDPLAIRYLLMSVHYRKQLNFTEEGIKQSQSALERVNEFMNRINRTRLPDGKSEEVTTLCNDTIDAFHRSMDDDLNTSGALGTLFDFIREINRRLAGGGVKKENKKEILDVMKRIDFVFDIIKEEEGNVDSQILSMIKERENAREKKNWVKADEIRQRLLAMGIILKDTPEGTVWKKEKK